MVNIYCKSDNQVQQRQRNLQIRQKNDPNTFTTTCRAYNAQAQDRCLLLTHPDYTEDYAGFWRPSKPHTQYELDLKILPSAYARRLVLSPHGSLHTGSRPLHYKRARGSLKCHPSAHHSLPRSTNVARLQLEHVNVSVGDILACDILGFDVGNTNFESCRT